MFNILNIIKKEKYNRINFDEQDIIQGIKDNSLTTIVRILNKERVDITEKMLKECVRYHRADIFLTLISYRD